MEALVADHADDSFFSCVDVSGVAGYAIYKPLLPYALRKHYGFAGVFFIRGRAHLLHTSSQSPAWHPCLNFGTAAGVDGDTRRRQVVQGSKGGKTTYT